MSDRKLSLLVMFKGVDLLSGALKNITGASSTATAGLRKLTAEARAQRQALDMVRDSLQNGATKNVTHLLDAEKRLQAQLENTNKEIKLQRTLMARQAQADAKGEKLRASGGKQMLMGGVMAAPLILAAKAAMDFQSGMSDIRIKADLTAAESDKMKASILAAAGAAKQLPESMRQGVDVLAGAGLDPRIAVQALEPIGKAATANFGTIEDLSKTSFAAIDNLKVPVGQLGLALDAMASAGKAGNFEMSDMALYFPQLTASAQALGQHGVAAVADLAAALEIARKGTGDAASAATNVQNLLAKINSKQTIDTFKKDFGVDLPAAMKKAAAEGKTPIEAIAELTKQMTKGDLSKIPQIFSDMQVQQALLPIIQNMDQYRKLRDDALHAQGTVNAAFAIKSKEAEANTRQLQASLANLALVVGDKLLPRLTPLVDDISKIIAVTADWAAAHPQLTDALTTTTASIAGLNVLLGGAKELYGNIVGPITAAANAYKWLTTSTKAAAIVAGITDGIAAAWGVITVAAGPYVAGMISAAAATWAVAWPVLAVVAACVLVAAAIAGVIWVFTHWDKVTAWFGGLWLKIKTYFLSIDWLKLGGDMLMGLVNGILGGIPMLLIAIGKVAMAGVDKFKKILGIHSPSKVFHGFGGNIAHGLTLGLADNMRHPLKQAALMAAGVAGAATMGLGSSATAGPAPGLSSTAPVIIQLSPGAIVVHAAPGQSAEDIGAAVEAALLRHARKAQSAKRSAYKDDDA